MKAITFTDSVNTCDCCGRTELKGTYLVLDSENNEYYYGSTCVKRNLSISQSELTNQINLDKKQRQYNANKEYKNSEIHVNYTEALKKDYEYMDDYYITVIKPLSKLDSELKNNIAKKYKLKYL